VGGLEPITGGKLCPILIPDLRGIEATGHNNTMHYGTMEM